MTVRVLVAPDKFKGTLSAADVADSVARGLQEEGLEAVTLPLADGGDGSVAAAVGAGFAPVTAYVPDALGIDTTGTLAVDDQNGTVVVEVANTVGIAGLSRLDPMGASSRGFGEAVARALELRPRRIVLALGGSASTDGGMGLFQALGAVFTDAEGGELPACGASLARLAHVDTSALRTGDDTAIVVAGDVTNPLLGTRGAAAVFGPQKGASPVQVRDLERGLANLVEILCRDHGPRARDVALTPGAGAAGGLGFAAMLLGGHVTSGADFFLDLLDFDTVVASCDAVVTGEGRIDTQTLDGKLPAVVVSRSAPRPVHVVAGRNDLTSVECARLGVRGILAVSDLTDQDTVSDPPLTRRLLIDAGRQLARTFQAPVVTQRMTGG